VIIAGAMTISTRGMTSNRWNLRLERRHGRVSARGRDGCGERERAKMAKMASGRGRSDWK
jgi:hypothetical protein